MQYPTLSKRQLRDQCVRFSDEITQLENKNKKLSEEKKQLHKGMHDLYMAFQQFLEDSQTAGVRPECEIALTEAWHTLWPSQRPSPEDNTCPRCHGWGDDANAEDMDCPRCRGEGEIYQ
jgi:DnaJ-class molecular chaperone